MCGCEKKRGGERPQKRTIAGVSEREIEDLIEGVRLGWLTPYS